MRHFDKLGTSILVGVAIATIAFGLNASPANAQNGKPGAATGATPRSTTAHTKAHANTTRLATVGNTAKNSTNPPPRRYFVEFRARNAASYGHMYILYGEVNSHNEIINSDIAGFHPAGDANDCENCSVYNWTIGHVVPVPGEMGASDGDLEEKYVTARYRIMLDAAEYQKLASYIAKRKIEKKLWNALFNNCVGFGKEVAEFMGLKMPIFIWLEPKDFVEKLRDLNGGHPQEALKDAPISPNTSVSSQPAAVPSGTSPVSRKPKKQPVANLSASRAVGMASGTTR